MVASLLNWIYYCAKQHGTSVLIAYHKHPSYAKIDSFSGHYIHFVIKIVTIAPCFPTVSYTGPFSKVS